MSDSNPHQTQAFWKKCNICKKEIPLGAKYYLCSVSTCRHERTGFRFCSVGCWDAHLGYANHRSAHAEEAKAPSTPEVTPPAPLASDTPTREPQRRMLETKQATPSQIYTSSAPSTPSSLPETDTLVVVSKVKQLIRDRSGFNTSECCIDALTRKTVEESLKAIERAKIAGRKTVMGRDIL